MNVESYHLLFIDDDVDFLNSMNIAMSSQQLGYGAGIEIQTHFVGEPLEGLAFVRELREEEEKIAVIISDQQMPGLTGIEFIEQANAIVPDAVKILLTGYASLDSARYAINHQILDQYVSKPIEDYEHFIALINNAIKTFQLREEKQEAERQNKQYVHDLELKNEKIKRLHLILEEKVLALQEAMQNAQDMAHKADAANHAKSEFLANISHELRTPLNGILGFASLGAKKVTTASSDTLQSYFNKILYSSNILLNLLNDLLDLAKLESGKMQFTFEPKDLNRFLASVADEFYSLTDERNLTIQISLPDEPAVTSLDADRILQLYRNLLSNAVKFSPDGGTITLSSRHEEDRVLVAVRDQGPGIPPDEIETIFDKFVQSRTTKTGAGGTGLGLSICIEIITAHQGRIWAENHPDGGAVFYVEHPLSQVAQST